MLRARLLILLTVTTIALISAGLLRAQELPPPVQAVLPDIGRQENRSVGADQLMNYSYIEVLDDFYRDCRQVNPLRTRFYAVNVDTDQGNHYEYHVTTDGTQVFLCAFRQLEPTRTPTIDLTRMTATPTIIPTVTETPRFGASRCEEFLYSRLRVREQGRVLLEGAPNSLRAQPGEFGEQLMLIPPGATFDVLEGPVCDSARHAWWRVRYLDAEGWTAEGEWQDYYVEPVIVQGSSFLTYTAVARRTATPSPTATATPSATWTPYPTGTPRPTSCPGSPAPRLTANGYGRVTPGEPNNLRSAPSTGYVVAVMPAGAVFHVETDLPTCDEIGRAWWGVRYEGNFGWTVEGIGSAYFVEPMSAAEANAR